MSVNQIISLPCQHALLVEQSKLICKRALWFFILSLFVSCFPCLFFFLFFFFFRPPLLRSPHWRVLLPHSERKGLENSLFHSHSQALMRWWILSQAGDVSHCLSNPQPHLAVIGFGPWLRGACQPDFLCRRAGRSLRGLPVGKWLQSHYSSSKALPGPVRHSPSAAVHLCSHSS